MKYILLFSTALMLLTACGEDKPEETVEELTAKLDQQLKQITAPAQEMPAETTPPSLSEKGLQTGPNPHAELSAEQHIAVAYQHAENGRMEQALDILARAIIANPNDASFLAALGGLLLGQDRAAEALEYLEAAVSLAPDSALLLVNRSQAYRKLNRSQEAMVDLDKAVALNPRLVPARFNRGVLLYDEARYKEALADFDVCIQAAPETAGPYFNRAVTHDALGDQAEAVSDMNKFLELSDNPEWNKVAQDTIATWEKNSN